MVFGFRNVKSTAHVKSIPSITSSPTASPLQQPLLSRHHFYSSYLHFHHQLHCWQQPHSQHPLLYHHHQHPTITTNLFSQSHLERHLHANFSILFSTTISSTVPTPTTTPSSMS